ncbi:MAG TPA: hypothetical protein VEL82_01425 [Thermoplasmata archaeon]|nr:hypothetical protein [Thermoplasmata archaeon]
MPAGPASQCEFRSENARCIFRDGHPGVHICIRPHGSMVPIRGEGEIPDPVYVWEPSPGDAGDGEDVRGLWTDGMVRRLLSEIREAGVAPPRDWSANLPRLRREAEASEAPGAGTERA